MTLRRENPALVALIAALAAAAFVVDVTTRIGIAAWVFYIAPLALSLFMLRPAAPVIVGAAASALTIAGYLLSTDSPDAEVSRLALVNRGFVLVVFVGFGLVGRQFIANKLRILVEDWIKAGQTGLSLRMQGEQRVEELGREVLSFVAEFLDAQVGGLHVAVDGGALVHCAAFASPIPEGAAATVRPGESLVGQAALDRRVMVVRDVPEGYLPARSGLGAARPRVLLLVPTRAEGKVNGVLELGFLGEPSPSACAYLEGVAGLIGAAMRSARYRQQQAELLEETQRQAEELQSQQEALRRANDELAAHGEALRGSHARLQDQQAELEATNAELEEQASALEAQKADLSEAQEMLLAKAAELERASRYKSEFLANMSHELRTPLNSALILAKLLADNRDGNLTPEQVQFARNIHTSGTDLLTLISDILDLSKIEAGKLDLNFEAVELARLFDGLRQRFAPLAGEKQLAFAVEVAPGCPATIETDAVRLQQIVTNLLSNAIKFTERGSIRLRAERGEGDEVRVSVRDTGVGIAESQQELIFEAFRQADGTTVRKYGGTGLGLSICRELAALLGGEIRLRSAPGRGSTFTVALPGRPRRSTRARSGAEPAPPSASRPAAAPVVDDRARWTPGARVVLVVEDDPLFAAILRDLARELGFDCVIARGADEGLQLAREYRPAAIVLDIGLPDHSGLTVLELLKRDATTRHIPILVVSVHDYQHVARELGVVGYALKPVKREALVAAFRRLEEQLARSSRQVLVVEDDAVQRGAIASLLASDRVAVLSASTADEGLARLRAETIDCVVLDLMLPGTSGFELLDRMAREDGLACPPVIVYTARALTLAEEQRLRRHARSIIIKGARSPERLLEEVTLFLHQGEADLPPEQRELLRAALDREAVFVGRRVLLVEDDVRNIFALTSALEPRGATIEVARNGKEALTRLAAAPAVDLVLMDLMMPEMDGLTATREIRKDPGRAALPIIALTAKAMPDDREQCLAAGANDYIAKPIDVEKLISLVRVWMPR